MNGSDWNGIKGDLRNAGRFDPKTIDQDVEAAFDRSLAKPGDANVKGSGIPGHVTKTMGYTEARGHLAEDGAKREAAPDRLAITETNKKSNAGGSDILTAEIDDKGKMTIISTDVKSLQATGNVTKVSAHEPEHLQKSLTRVSEHSKEMVKNAEEIGLSQSEMDFHQKVHETVDEILKDIPDAIEKGTLQLEVDNTGGNSGGTGGQAKGQVLKDRRLLLTAEEHEARERRLQDGDRTDAKDDGSPSGEKAQASDAKLEGAGEAEGGASPNPAGADAKTPVIVDFKRHGVPNEVREKHNLAGERDYARDISGQKQKERTSAERQEARGDRPAGSVQPYKLAPKSIKIINGLKPNARGNLAKGGKDGRPARSAPGVTEKARQMGIPERQATAPVDKGTSRADVRQAGQGDFKGPGSAPATPGGPTPPPKGTPSTPRPTAPAAPTPSSPPTKAPSLPGDFKGPGSAPVTPSGPTPPSRIPPSQPAGTPVAPKPPPAGMPMPSTPPAGTPMPALKPPPAGAPMPSARPDGAGAITGAPKPPPAGMPMPAQPSPSPAPSPMAMPTPSQPGGAGSAKG